MPDLEVKEQGEVARFRFVIEGDRIRVVDVNGVCSSYVEWALENTELTQEVFDHAKALLHGSGPALEGWLALAEPK